MENQLHVIFGTGPVGCWTARALIDRGLPVRAVNRSGKRPGLLPEEAELVKADVTDPVQALAAAEGAAAVYQALNPPYDKWAELFPTLQANALAAAKAAGARYVSVENLYAYDSSVVMTEDGRIAPVSKKGELRRRMADEVAAAHQRGEVRAAQLRSADYYGPGVTQSAAGDPVVGRLLAGKKAQVGGSASQPHSFAYIEDVGRAAAELGVRDEALGHVWFSPHAPAVTQGDMVTGICRELGKEPALSVISATTMRLAGLFSPGAKETVEMLYEFDRPFVVDASRSERKLGLTPTPTDEGVRRTIAWYASQSGR
jgi:nucleoside-diphosphate-sugar epimerase